MKMIACTQPLYGDIGWQLRQWTEYHSLLGVEHFFIYLYDYTDVTHPLEKSNEEADDQVRDLSGFRSYKPWHLHIMILCLLAVQTLDAVVNDLVNKGIATRVDWGPSRLPGFQRLGLDFDPAASAESARIRLQQPAMNHCLGKAGVLAEWTLFIDVDEYLFPLGRLPGAGSTEPEETEQHPLPSVPDMLSTPFVSELKIQVRQLSCD